MTTLFFDTETFSPTPIACGTHRYAEDVEVMIAAWAVDDGPVTVEDLTAPADGGCPTRLRDLFDRADEIVMHQSAFDRTVIRHAWGVDLPLEKVHDTMVRALAHGLPGSLDKLCGIMGVPADLAKDKEGKALIQLFCKPMPKNSKIRRATRETHPLKWKDFLAYAGSDILSMRELHRKLPRWNYQGRELDLWRLDQAINDRGFLADVELAERALDHVAEEQKALRARTQALTNGEVQAATQRDELLRHILAAYGVDLPDLTKDTLERRLADETLPEALKQLIQVRLATATTSTAKYRAVMRSVSRDGRLRGSLQFCGAMRTGRWSGRLFQPQNLPRPAKSSTQAALEEWIAAVKRGDADLVFATEETMRLAADALRGMIVAAPGRKIVSSDLSNIEGRVAAWLAGERWKLDAFAEIDAADDEDFPDMYARAYAKSFNVTPQSVMADKKAGGDQRQVGKVQELALGYEGGVGAFLSFAEVYRLDLEDMAERAYDALPHAARTQAEIMLGWRRKKGLTTFGLSDRAFVVCEAFKALWRAAHPAISAYWQALQAAAIEAVARPGVAVVAGPLRFVRKGAWLRMVLPSGRSLCYPAPQVKGDKLSYMGVNQYTRKWQRLSTYGGKLFENACQAVARDVMAWNMPAIEAAGFPIVLTVHDDVITEPVDDDKKTIYYLSSLLAANPPWLKGCPLKASGFEAHRYRKD